MFGILLLFGVPAHAADVAAGRALHDKNCNSCHASLMKGQPSRIYTRPDRRVQSYQGLVSQVRRCAASLGAQWSDEPVNDVAAFLNQEYYKF
jgi:mono/diheme cytochrome c family protein